MASVFPTIILCAILGAKDHLSSRLQILEKQYIEEIEAQKPTRKNYPDGLYLGLIERDMKKQPVDLVVPFLNCHYWEIRSAAAFVLTNREDARSRQDVKTAAAKAFLTETSPRAQERLMYLVGVVKAEGAIPLLEKMLARERNSARRRHAAITLGQIGSRKAIPALIRAARDEHPDVIAMALWSLIRIPDPQGVAVLRQFAFGPESPHQLRAISGLGELADTDSAVRLLEMAANAKKEVGAAALKAVAKMASRLGDRLVMPLIPLLEEKDKVIRSGAYSALSASQSPKALLFVLERSRKRHLQSLDRYALYRLYPVSNGFPKALLSEDQLAAMAKALNKAIDPKLKLGAVKPEAIASVRKQGKWHFIQVKHTSPGKQRTDYFVLYLRTGEWHHSRYVLSYVQIRKHHRSPSIGRSTDRIIPRERE